MDLHDIICIYPKEITHRYLIPVIAIHNCRTLLNSKTGTTWTQEIVYLIMNDCNVEKAKAQTLEERFPCIEFTFPGEKPVDPKTLPRPRMIKIHMPYKLLPQSVKDKKCKVKLLLFDSSPTGVYRSFRIQSRVGKNIQFRILSDLTLLIR